MVVRTSTTLCQDEADAQKQDGKLHVHLMSKGLVCVRLARSSNGIWEALCPYVFQIEVTTSESFDVCGISLNGSCWLRSSCFTLYRKQYRYPIFLLWRIPIVRHSREVSPSSIGQTSRLDYSAYQLRFLPFETNRISVPVMGPPDQLWGPHQLLAGPKLVIPNV